MRTQSTLRRAAVAVASLATVLLGAAAVTPAPAQAAQQWAPAATAAIHPGTMMYTEGAQCTANFVYTDGAGAVYVGYAAHCAGLGEATDTNGCQADSLPLGTRVTFNEGGSLVSEGTQVESGDLVPAAELLRRIGPVSGLSKIMSALGMGEGDESPGHAAAALEFALEGLYLLRRLSKDEIEGGGARYRT